MTHNITDILDNFPCLTETDTIRGIVTVTGQKQKKSYFFHSECQRIRASMCRLRSHGRTGPRSDTGTALHIPARNCRSHTLRANT